MAIFLSPQSRNVFSIDFSSKVWREINSSVNNSSGSKMPVHSHSDFDNAIKGNSNKWLSSDDNSDVHHDVNDNNVRAVTRTQDDNLHKVIGTTVTAVPPLINTRDNNYLALSDTETVDCYTVPSPIYPTTTVSQQQHYPSSTLPLPSTNIKRRTREQMTRHQIINLYCTNSDRER